MAFPANMPVSGHEAPAEAEFSCARCWKQKKKCDKVAPRCGRCTVQAAVCVYSSLPPKESVFSVKPIEPVEVQEEVCQASCQVTCFSLDLPHTNHSIPDNRVIYAHFDLANGPRPGQVLEDHWEQDFISQVNSIFTVSGTDAESVCRTYFTEFHSWISFLSEPDFWRDFSAYSSHPELSTLLLAMYLVTYIPSQDSNHMENLDHAYLTGRNAWLHFQKIQGPSMVLIQAGLLVATYENGQNLIEKSRSTVVMCAEMGYKMRLHKSLQRTFDGGLCSQNELRAKRQLWWGIVALERLLSAKDLDEGYIFATAHPKLDDFLPSDYNGSFSDIPYPKVVGLAAKVAAEPVELVFTDVDAYSAVVQACYLLGRVMSYIKCNTLSFKQQETESTFLDGTLQAFARSLLRQAANSSSASTIQGHYCTPFFLSLIALLTLHRHELKQCSPDFPQQDRCISAEYFPPQRPTLALQALARMLYDMTWSLKFSNSEVLKLPSFELHIFYLSLWLHIKFGDRSNEVGDREGFRQNLVYLRVAKSRWKIAGVYIAEIAALRIEGFE